MSKKTGHRLINCCMVMCIILFSSAGLFAQTAEVTKSGNTWTTEIDGNEVYSGSSLGDAIRTASGELGSGTINIRNSGDLSGGIDPRANQTFDFHENEISGGNFEGFQAKHTNGITIRNFYLRDGANSISFHGCSDVHLHNIELLMNNGNGVRIDNDRYSNPVTTTGLTVTGGIRIEGTDHHGFETYTIDGIEIDRITTRNTGSCGLLFNDSRNIEVGVVDAYRANYGGGYAGFRTANSNGPNTHVDTVYAEECGRGFFSCSGSHGTTIEYVEITGCTGHGMLIQNAQNVSVNGGIVWNNDCAEAVRIDTDAGSAGGGDATTNCTVQNLRIYDDRGGDRQQVYGIRESPGDGTDGNYILNNDIRDGGSSRSNDLIVSGANTVAEGNTLTGDDPPDPVIDCAGVEDGNAYIDSCGQCVGGTTGQEPCQQDCNGDWGGDAYLDDYGICVGGETGLEPFTGAIEGEDATDYDGVIESDNTGYTGDGYINYTNEVGASAVWRICSDSSFSSEIAVRYSNGSGTNRNLSVSVNGNQQTGDLEIPATDSWTDWKNAVVSVSLTEGENQLELVSISSDGGPNIDIIGFSNSGVHVCQTNTKELRQNKQSGDMGILYSKGKISLRLKRQKKIQLGIYSISGRKVADLFKGRASVGLNLIEVDETGLTNGLYILILKDEGGVVIRQRLRFVE